MNKKRISALITSSVVMAGIIIPADKTSGLDYTAGSSGAFTSSAKSGVIINGIKVSRQLININYDKGITIKPRYIVIHDTDNRRYGVNAQANRNYFATQIEAKASAHYVVDQDTIIQALEDNWRGWHVGDKFNPKVGNGNTIAIEMCVNIDNNFNKTVENAIALTKYLMKKYDIPASNVIRHYDVTGKICPRMMIQDKPSLWSYFKNSISDNESASYGVISNVSTAANVRNGASTDSQVIASLDNGRRVQIVGSENGWYKVRTSIGSGSITGYVYNDYVKGSDGQAQASADTKETPDNRSTSISSSSAVVDGVSLNLRVRKGAGKNYSVIGYVLNGENIEILSSEGSWYKIQYSSDTGSKQGYVMKDYIKVI